MTRLLAVSRLSAADALRSRLVAVVTVVLLIGCAGLALGVEGDGTPAGRLRNFLSWEYGLDAFVVSLVAVFLGPGLGAHLRDGRLVPWLMAPLPRWLLPLGWWGGVGAVLALLVLLSHALVGLGVLGLHLAGSPAARDAMAPVLSARGAVRADPPYDEARVQERAAARLAEAERRGALEGLDPDEALAQLAAEERTRFLAAPPGYGVSWTVRGIEPGAPGDVVTLRFLYQVQGSELPVGRGPRGRWLIEPVGVPSALEQEGAWSAQEMHELPIPAAELGGATELRLTYQNLDQGAVLVTFPERGPEVLYPAGAFAPNLLRSALVLLGRLLFLAAIGVGAAALIDPRLATLVVVFFLLVGAGHGFLADALAPGVYGELRHLLRPVFQATLWLIPDLGRDDLSGLLADGRRVGWDSVRASLLQDGLLTGVVLLLGAGALFARREPGARRT